MKRLILAAGLSLVLHGLFFSADAEWLRRELRSRAKPQPITLALTCRRPILQPSRISKRSLMAAKRAASIEKTRPQEKPVSNAVKAPEPPKKEKPQETVRPPKKVTPRVQTKKKAVRKKRVRKVVKSQQSTLKPLQTAMPPSKPEVPQKLESPPQETRPQLVEWVKMTPVMGGPYPATEPTTAHVPLAEKSKEAGDARQVAAISPAPALKEAIPVYRENPRPKYPLIARRRGYEGKVILEVLVGREGKVKEIRIARSSGYRALDRSAKETVLKWLFEPGMRGDETVEMWVKVPIRYQLK